MDYEFWFWIIVAFALGRVTARPLFYYGRDEAKYKRALFSVMPRWEK